MKFLKVPFLPEGDVKYVLLSREYFDRYAPEIEKLGITPVPSPYSPSLPGPVRYHPDMNCRHLGGNRFAVFSDAKGTRELEKLGARFIFADPPMTPNYPYDAALNALPFGKLFVHCDLSVCSLLKYEFKSLEPVPVKQGYCACSVAIVKENAVLTGDPGIEKALVNRGISVVKADNGNIALPGYGNGFIGGASGLIAPGRLCFTGSPEGVVDIISLKALGIECVCLKEDKMLDIGGIVPLSQ